MTKSSLEFRRLSAQFGTLEDLCAGSLTVQDAVLRLNANLCDADLVSHASSTQPEPPRPVRLCSRRPGAAWSTAPFWGPFSAAVGSTSPGYCR